MRDWSLSRVVQVADRRFTLAENDRYLRKGGNHYIIGERRPLRLSRGGRRPVTGGPLQGSRGQPPDGTDALAKGKRAGLRDVISTKPWLNRYLRRPSHRAHLPAGSPRSRRPAGAICVTIQHRYAGSGENPRR